ncbi:hypothetical protein NLI96_g5745 [Meripilus lineatus]|uniref:E2 ubiquitin-conjugating enzyme n=1 Tax=Meripilus lineatus TaxID=2056292 RepID=A0AAD5V770_9APHY|nr:hypothetical protein NLI96_g5745 [Physisporinus lineatus]
MPPSSTSTTTLKRIHREIADLKKEDLGAITLEPSSDSLFLWKATLPGPEGSCYEGGVFQVDISLPQDYPFSSPKMTFRTRIYHMNISERGGICIDILKHNWSPALSLFKVILSLSSLLTDPNPKDPLVPSIAKEYVTNRKKHDNTARQWTELYARPPPPRPSPPIVVVSPPLPSPRRSRPRHTHPTNLTPVPFSSQTDPITIDDSDDESSAPVRSTPRGTARRNKRKRGAPASEETATSGDGSGEPSRTRLRMTEENTPVEVNGVIVIDDD